MGEWLIVKSRNAAGERYIHPDKWFIDRSTPIGEPADFYEDKPFGGKRLIPEDTILRREPFDNLA